MTIEAADGTSRCVCMLWASTSEQRSQGLVGVTDLGGYAGMLFTREEVSGAAFLMSGVPIELAIAWWDAEGGLISTAEMAPCLDQRFQDCPRYSATEAYRYAIEVPAGDLDDMGVEPGAVLSFSEGCRPGLG